jgi:hypothetical protein
MDKTLGLSSQVPQMVIRILALGIGRAFALSLAREGFNIILSARTESKLEKVK